MRFGNTDYTDCLSLFGYFNDPECMHTYRQVTYIKDKVWYDDIAEFSSTTCWKSRVKHFDISPYANTTTERLEVYGITSDMEFVEPGDGYELSVLSDGSKVVYLSDETRIVGFITLRTANYGGRSYSIET